ncbi:hypothetical protein ACB092_01G270200 [Castanea dentata]
MAMRYWVVSLPVQNSASSLWNRLQDQLSKHSFDTPLYRAMVRMKALSERCSAKEGVIARLHERITYLADGQAQYKDANRVLGTELKDLKEKLAEESRRWKLEEEAKLTAEKELKSILVQVETARSDAVTEFKDLSSFIDACAAYYGDRFEDCLKQVRVAEYNNVRSQLNAINRKQSGSIAVRDLSNLVKPEDIITSEHLVTLLAIVPKYSQKDWLASYETLTSYVVPRSSKKLYEEYALHTVTLFGRVADDFRTAARERGFQIRDFKNIELEKLLQDQGSLRSSLLQWCYNSYGEACVLAPSVKSEKKVRSILEGLCDSANRRSRRRVAGLAGDADAHPYVSFTINLI